MKTRWRWLTAVLAIAALCGLVQYRAGAWGGSYGAFPDEPAHFVGGLMVRDFLLSGSLRPVQFAAHYYLYQPFFAIGYWPPVFYLIEGVWMLVAGYSRVATMIFVLAIAVLLATLLFMTVRRSASFLMALVMAAVFLSMPSVQWSTSVVMTDLMVAVFCLLATLAMGKFLEEQEWRWAILGALAASLAFLTKYLAAFVFLPPLVLLLIDRRVDLLRKARTWAMAGIMAALIVPWLLVSRRFTFIAFDDFSQHSFPSRAVLVLRLLVHDMGPLLAAAALFATIWAFVNWKSLTQPQRLLVLQMPCLGLFLVVGPTPDLEARYMIVAYPALLTILALAIERLSSRLSLARPAAVLVLVVLAVVRLIPGVTPLYSSVAPQVARDLVADQQFAAVLVPAEAEGTLVAEMAAAESARSKVLLLRPSKILARMTWTGADYESLVPDAAAMTALFDKYPIEVVVTASYAGRAEAPHDKLLREMLSTDARWRRVRQYAERGATWAVYRRTLPAGMPMEPLFEFVSGHLRPFP